MKRDLFVFSGQSNMMGSCVIPPKHLFSYKYSYEYLHKNKRLGKDIGDFKKEAYPVGEWSYRDLNEAYKNNEKLSSIDNFMTNTYFSQAISNINQVNDLTYSEKNNEVGVSLAPVFVNRWERLGRKCAFAHIAKSAISLSYFLNNDMVDEANKNLPLELKQNHLSDFHNETSNYFFLKLNDFFIDSKKRFDDLSDNKVLFFLQGEADCYTDYLVYKEFLRVFFNKCMKYGINKIIIIRVGYWDHMEHLKDIMKAQEDIAKEMDNVYIGTRILSFIPFSKDDYHLYNGSINKNYLYCRDSDYGYDNHHINLKGFKLIAKQLIPNTVRIINNKKPLLEKEKVKALL